MRCIFCIWLSLCVFSSVFGASDVEEGPPDMRGIWSRLGVRGNETLSDKEVAQALLYIHEKVEDLGLPMGVRAQLRSLKDDKRLLSDLILGTTIGVSAAWAWSIVFEADPNVAYFLFPHEEGKKFANTDDISYPVLLMTLAPEIMGNIVNVGKLRFKSKLAKACEAPHTKTHVGLTWGNRIITTIFLAKFFKVFYASTWGSYSSDGSQNADNSDYWFAATYLWSSWWKKYGLLKHKIHIIDHNYLHHHSPGDSARHELQSWISGSYRKLQSGDDKFMMRFAYLLREANNRMGKNDEDKQKVAFASLVAFCRYTTQASDEGPFKIEDTYHAQKKPFSLRAFETFGRICATSVIPFALLGSYFAWDSILEVSNLKDEHFHFEDKHMTEPDSWVYAVIATAYTGVTGWTVGPIWARNLWCRWHGVDPNIYEEDVEYWPQNMSGVRSIMGGGISYLISSVLMFPIAGLATEQMYVMGWPMDTQKAVLATTAIWGIFLDNMLGPHYQAFITAMGKTTGRDEVNTIKDALLKKVIDMHDAIGRLKDDKAIPLLAQVKEVMGAQVQGLEEAGVRDIDDDGDDIFYDCQEEPYEMASMVNGSSLGEPLLPEGAVGHQRTENREVEEGAIYRIKNFFWRIKCWFVGADTPPHLRPMVRHILKTNTP